MVGAGLRNQKIDINNVGEGEPDDTGYRPKGLVPYRLGVYANVAQISGKETNISKTFSTTCTHVVRINYDSSVNQSQVIVWNDRTLHVDGVIDPDGMRRETAIYCTETVGLSCPPTIAKGFSGYSGTSGFSGYSGTNGATGTSGFSGFSGISGFSGFSGYGGYSGFSGISGYSGYSGKSGYSGYSGSGFSGYSGSAASNLVTSVAGRSGAVTLSESDISSLVSDLSLKSPIANPTFTGDATHVPITGSVSTYANNQVMLQLVSPQDKFGQGSANFLTIAYNAGFTFFSCGGIANNGFVFANNIGVTNNTGFINANDGGGIVLSGGGTLVKDVSNTTIADFESGNITFNQPLKANTINMSGTAIFDSTGPISIGNAANGNSTIQFWDDPNGFYGGTINVSDSQMNIVCTEVVFTGDIQSQDCAVIRALTFATFSPSSYGDGMIWYDGTNYKCRLGGVTKTFTVT